MRYRFMIGSSTPSSKTPGAVDLVGKEIYPDGVDPAQIANVGAPTGRFSLHATDAEAMGIVAGSEVFLDVTVVPAAPTPPPAK